MNVTRDTIKHQGDFKNRNDFTDYLFNLCEIGLKEALIYSRLARNQHPFDIITARKVLKPGRNHPYKREYLKIK